MAAADLICDTALFKKSQHIACYFAVAHEFDCMPIMKAIWQTGKNCYLPKLSSLSKDALQFCQYDEKTQLKLNKYRIQEPDTLSYFPAEQLDLVLMPLVGFDLQGHRLGMGAGYYDRTFQFLHKQTSPKPFMLGLAYELQKITNIPSDSWDVSMDGVLTEEQLYLFS